MLEKEYPEIAQLWDSDLNGDVTPSMVDSNSKKKVWWKCSDSGESYQRTVRDQVSSCGRSPYVSGKRLLKGYNDLESHYPDIAELWDHEDNKVKPDEVYYGSRKKFSWVCPESGGKYIRTVSQQVSAGVKSPYMTGQAVLPGYNDLLSQRPEVAQLWHPTKNGDLTNEDVTPYSHKKVWWMVDREELELSVRAMSSRTDPQFRIIPLSESHPELLEIWDYEKNSCSPEEISQGSRREAWWICPDTGVSYSRAVNMQVRVGGVSPYQKREGIAYQRILIGYNDLKTVYPEVSEMWDYEKNCDLSPEKVLSGSRKEVWWICPESGGSYRRSVRLQVRSGKVSPYMTGHLILKGYNDIKTTYPSVAKRLTNPEEAENLTFGSDKIVSWICPEEHHYDRKVREVIRNYRERGTESCPVCSNSLIISGVNDLATLYPHLISEWNDEKDPAKIGRSNYVAKWKCSEGHEWNTRIYDRISKDYGCPRCSASGGEKDLAAFIDSLDLQTIVVRNSRKVISPMELDLFLPEKNIAIEYNGVHWHSEESGKERNYHYDKWLACKKKGIQLIIVWEDDWINKKDIVMSMLKHKLGVGNSPKVFARNTLVDHNVSYRESSSFLDDNHIQGSVNGSVYIGLRDSGGVLVAVSVWRKIGDDLYLDRYATSINVVGGMGKLLKYGKKYGRENGCRKIVTFADHEVSDGGLYEKLGFEENSFLDPDYKYVVGGERKHKFGYRVKRFQNDPRLEYQDGLTERQLAEINCLPRVWDCGKTRYVMYL